jgi:hypothetical protein
MKILMVSIPSLHFFRWTEQLKDAGYDIYWFDITGSEQDAVRINWVHQITRWKLKWNFPGRYFVKKRFPKFYAFLKLFNEYSTAKVFEQKLLEIQPDVVQFFEMTLSGLPILKVMEKNRNIKWIYSAWGNDLYYFQNDQKMLKEIKEVLFYVDFMFADCFRDYVLAKKYGFNGELLGIYPTGGGYDFSVYDKYMSPFSSRQIILIKGYEHKFGRCNNVLKGIERLKKELVNYQIVVFGANQKVLDFSNSIGIDTWENFKIYKQLNHNEILRLMGQSLIYIGNSISDGMPNTLLEAIVMGVFPIQSNPGGATAELIQNRKNGMLIEDSENLSEIKKVVVEIFNDFSVIENGIQYNLQYIKPKLEYHFIKTEVLKKYEDIVSKKILNSNFI